MPAAGLGKIGFDVRDIVTGLPGIADDGRDAVALIAGLLDGGIAPALGTGWAVCAFAQQAPGPVDGMGVVAVQATHLPDRHADGYFPQAGGRSGDIGFIGGSGQGMGGGGPALLIVTGKTHHIVGHREAASRRRALLKPVQAQEFDAGDRVHRVRQVRIMAGAALYLGFPATTGRFQRHRRPDPGPPDTNMRCYGRIKQLPVGRGEGCVVVE